jgi:hypothetical protein
MSFRGNLLLFFYLAACSGSPETSVPPIESSDAGGDLPDAGSVRDAGQPPIVGPTLWLSPTPEGSGIRVMASNLGPAFGVSYHLAYEGTAKGVTQATFLGASGEQALYLKREKQGDLALGGTRLFPLLGDADLGSEIELARVEVTGKVSLRHVVVRKADGSYLPVTTRDAVEAGQ